MRLLISLFCALALFAQEPKELAALRYIDLQPGTGAPAAPGKRFTVHYTGWLKDGTKFDSSRDRNEPFKFVQGRRQVISGWDMGFEGMKAGGRRKLIIPYQLAYGEAGSGPIPPKAELTFDVELLDVTDASPLVPAIDILVPLKDLAARIEALATAEHLKNPEFRTFVRRIIFFNTQYLAAATRDEPVLYDADLKTMNLPSLEGGEMAAKLKESFEMVIAELNTARNGSLAADASLLGQTSSRRGIYTALVATIAEQIGQTEAQFKK